jgi:aspartate kinase
MRTVLKFGGTSVASPAALQRVAEIVKGTRGQRIVVVSATAGTTDALIGAARAAEGGDAKTTGTSLRTRSGSNRRTSSRRSPT